jgi:hypothetical protein
MLMFAGPDVSETIERIVSTLRESVALMGIVRKQHEDSGRHKDVLHQEKLVQNSMKVAADQIASAYDGGNDYGGLGYRTDDGRAMF